MSWSDPNQRFLSAHSIAAAVGRPAGAPPCPAPSPCPMLPRHPPLMATLISDPPVASFASPQPAPIASQQETFHISMTKRTVGDVHLVATGSLLACAEVLVPAQLRGAWDRAARSVDGEMTTAGVQGPREWLEGRKLLDVGFGESLPRALADLHAFRKFRFALQTLCGPVAIPGGVDHTPHCPV